ncbi:hypothetical protein ACQKWADRAFT_296844 [Trichoderma austrokoningii]
MVYRSTACREQSAPLIFLLESNCRRPRRLTGPFCLDWRSLTELVRRLCSMFFGRPSVGLPVAYRDRFLNRQRCRTWCCTTSYWPTTKSNYFLAATIHRRPSRDVVSLSLTWAFPC